MEESEVERKNRKWNQTSGKVLQLMIGSLVTLFMLASLDRSFHNYCLIILSIDLLIDTFPFPSKCSSQDPYRV